MARYIFQGTFRDGQGNIVSDGSITVYVAGSTTPATIYSTDSGGSAVTGAVVTSDSYGKFNFYIDDSDYSSTSKFDIVISKEGYISQTYEDIVLPIPQVIPTVTIDGILPTQTGNSGKFLTTNATVCSWGEVHSIPSGGTDGQVLTKTSATNYETAWEAIPESASIIETQVFM